MREMESYWREGLVFVLMLTVLVASLVIFDTF